MVGLRRGQPAASPNGNLLVCVTSAMSSKHLHSFRPTADCRRIPAFTGRRPCESDQGDSRLHGMPGTFKGTISQQEVCSPESPNTIALVTTCTLLGTDKRPSGDCSRVVGYSEITRRKSIDVKSPYHSLRAGGPVCGQRVITPDFRNHSLQIAATVGKGERKGKVARALFFYNILKCKIVPIARSK